jgi:hypothetical protein
MQDLRNDYERAEYLQNLLISEATGGSTDEDHYQQLRRYFLDRPDTKELIPGFLRTNRDLKQFWQFIKFKHSTYAARRAYIWSECSLLLTYLEAGTKRPADLSISEGLKRFDEESVHVVWGRALERRKSDPEGAITAARSLLETVCKHILDEQNIHYDQNKVELHELYKLTANELSLALSQHTQDVFRQILGGCSAIVNGLGTLRNRLGDAHGQGKAPVRPAPRHAELAVNLAGALALFLVETWSSRNSTKT